MVGIQKRQWFSVPVWETQIPDRENINAEILSHLDELLKEGRGTRRSNVGGWHSHDQLHHDVRFHVVRDAIANVCFACASEMEFDHQGHDLVMKEMWLNKNGPGDFNSPHVHPNSFLSGVYYIEIPENGGDIEFMDPSPGRQMTAYPSERGATKTARTIVYRAISGLLLVFPSWLQHSVQPNHSGNDRVSISFNIGYREKMV